MQLSAALPSSGGEAVYLSRAFHPLCGFWYTFVTASLAKPCGCALIAIVFSDYVCRLHWTCNEFADDNESCDTPPEWVRKGVALAAVWFLGTVQILSTSAATVVQGFFTVEKLLLVLTLCVLGVANAATPGGLARIPDQFGNTTDARGLCVGVGVRAYARARVCAPACVCVRVCAYDLVLLLSIRSRGTVMCHRVHSAARFPRRPSCI